MKALRDLSIVIFLGFFALIQLCFARSIELSIPVPRKPRVVGSAVGGSSSTGDKAASQVTYITPGELSISAQRQCGDGDVASYSNRFPNVDFVPNEQPTLPVVAGFWVAESDATSRLPTKDNWRPIGYSNVIIGETSSFELDDTGRKFYSLNKVQSTATPARNFYQLISALNYFGYQAQRSFKDSRKYRINVALMACATFQGAGNQLTANAPNSTELSYSFIKNIYSIVRSKRARTEAEYEGLKKYSLVYQHSASLNFNQLSLKNRGPVNIIFSSSGARTIPSSNRAFFLGKKVMELVYPGEETAVAVSPILAPLTNMKNNVDDCRTHEDFNEIRTIKPWWDLIEPLRECSLLNASLKRSYNKLFKRHATEEDFLSRRNDLASLLLQVALLKDSQEYGNTLFTQKDDLRCFVGIDLANEKYIDKIIASIPVELSVDATQGGLLIFSPPQTMGHPEYLYALDDYAEYHADNNKTIFGMTNPATSSDGLLFELGLGGGIQKFPFINLNSAPDSMWYKLRIRSIGCPFNVYC